MIKHNVTFELDLTPLNDVFIEVGVNNELITDEFLKNKFETLPSNIKAFACMWSCNDTEVRDTMYTYWKEKENA